MNLFRPITILFTGLVLACLCCCHEKPADLSHHRSQLVDTKELKPGAAVKLISSSIIFINANELAHIELLLDVKESSGILILELSPANGLDLVDTQKIQRINLSSSMPIKVPLKVKALINSRYYLNIHAAIDNGDSLSARNLALIVQVGPEIEKSIQLKKTAGENVISLPAQETISNP